MSRLEQLQQRMAAQLPPPEREVSKQWAKVETLMAEGTITIELTKQLRVLRFLCDKALNLLFMEHQMGVSRHEDLYARANRVMKTDAEALELLKRLGEA